MTGHARHNAVEYLTGGQKQGAAQDEPLEQNERFPRILKQGPGEVFLRVELVRKGVKT
jgi:hypothetical protein